MAENNCSNAQRNAEVKGEPGMSSSSGVKPEGGASKGDVKGESIKISVRMQNQENTEFKLKVTTKFKKVIAAFCQKKGLEPGQIRFMFDGQRIHDEQTPKFLEMEDGDQIDVMIEQQGGSLMEQV